MTKISIPLRTTCLVLAATFALQLSAEAYLSPATRLRLSRVTESMRKSGPARESAQVYHPLIIQLHSAEALEEMEELGVIVYHHRDNIYLTSVPDEQLNAVLALEGVANVASAGEVTSVMDVARPFSNVNVVQGGDMGLPHGYDGTGVVVGFSDTGFDQHHIAFKGRVAEIVDYDTSEGVRVVSSTPEEVEDRAVDTSSQYHATHVAGILAGGYTDGLYYGVATGSEIVATTSKLHDVGILSGIEDVIAYAKEQGKPAVVNVSMANYLGPHDGTDLVCRYLSKCAEDGVICFSAGNAGDQNCFARQDLAESEARVRVGTYNGWNGFNVEGYTDIWSDNSTPFEIAIEVYNGDTGKVVFSTPWFAPGESVEVTPETYPEWGEYMSGYVRAECSLSPLNDRYNVTMMYDTHTTPQSSKGAWSLYTNCFAVRAVEGEAATAVNIFVDNTQSYLSNVNGSPTRVGNTGSINDMATADGIVCVGMAVSRTSAPELNGGTLTWTNGTVGNVSKYSSYSTVPCIPTLPHFCAPGFYIVSAMSTPYYNAHPDVELSAVTNVDGKDYYWKADCGTSMASPFAAGVIATWLQADPTLTAKDVIDIARKTANTSYADIDNPRWGAGCINAAEGVKEVLNRAGLSGTSPLWPSDGEEAVYTLTGIRVEPGRNLAPGIYIHHIPGVGARLVKSEK